MRMIDTPPPLDKMPAPCRPCDMTIALGLLTGTCESLDPDKKGSCRTLLEPLEQGRADAVDAIANVLVEMGSDSFNDTVDRMNMLIYQATEKAKETLIEKGVLKPDGTPADDSAPEL